ncbi:MAG: glycosyltransferase [Candidatus Pacebacteria bacterium]|nr:glycosyltransferase [Candidatus Paceibacterota bacterium]
MISILYSHQLRALPFAAGNFVPGAANYSYNIVADRLRTALRYAGLSVHDVDFPGVYTTELAINNLKQRIAPQDRFCHMAVKPLDHIELMRGVPNVIYYAWEFDRLTAQRTNNDPRTNQLLLLRQFDKIMVPCTFQHDVFQTSGLTQTVVVPIPVPIGNDSDALTSALKLNAFDFRNRENILLDMHSLNQLYKGRIFLSVFNPLDPRKNFRNILMAAASIDTHAVFIFKFTLDPNKTSTAWIIKRFGIDGVRVGKALIYFIPSYISEHDMHRLMQTANFALSASTAEGQNLPLLEGMAHGQIPVAPRHTAMLDYIDSDTSCVIASRPVKAPARTSYLGEADLRMHISNSEDISSAINNALSLSDTAVGFRSKACQSLVSRRYSTEAVAYSIRSLFGSM